MSYDLFENRKIYKENFPNSYNFNAKPIDMWLDRTHYGKIDFEQNVISITDNASEEKLKQLRVTSPGEELFLAIDFVADAFNDFKSHFRKADAFGKIGNEGIRELVQTNGFKSPNSEYEKYFINIADSFVFTYARENPNVNKNIVDFESFMKYFMQFARNFSNKFPITRTGMIKSRFCSPLVSGLIIEVSAQDHDNDLGKYTWLEDVNFDFYRNTARKFGFMIDKNAPWRLIADINSIPLQRYWQKSRVIKKSKTNESKEPGAAVADCWDVVSKEVINYYPNEENWTRRERIDKFGNKTITEIEGGNTEDYLYPTSAPHFLSEYYEKTHMSDIKYLKERLLSVYNMLVAEFPTVNTSRVKGCILDNRYVTEKLVYETVKRKPLDEEDHEYKKITDYQWLNIYMDLRIYEEGVNMSRGEYKSKIRRLKKIFKHVDKEMLDNGSALCYINEQTKQLVYRPSTKSTSSPNMISTTGDSTTTSMY